MTPDEVDRLAARPTDSRVFRAEVLDRLRRSVGFDSFAWVLTDPVTTVGVDPFAQLPDLRALPTVVRLKYLTDVNRWTSLTDASSLGDRAEESRLWREVQRPHGVADVASVGFKDRFGCWGFLDLWSSRTFTAAEVDVLRRLTPHLTTALRRRQAATFAVVAPDRAQAGPAVLLLRDDLGIAGQTGAAEAWMSVMLPPSSGVPPVPAAAYNVAAQLLAREHGVDDHEPMARTHLADGLWATVRASRVEPGELIAVSVEARARPTASTSSPARWDSRPGSVSGDPAGPGRGHGRGSGADVGVAAHAAGPPEVGLREDGHPHPEGAAVARARGAPADRLTRSIEGDAWASSSTR